MDEQKLRVLDVATGKELRIIEGHEFTIYAVAFSPDGQRILSGDGSCLRLWDVQTGKQLRRLKGRNGNLSSLATSPDGRYAVSGHSAGSGVELIPPRDLFLWDLQAGKVACCDRIILHRWITQRLFSTYYKLLPDNLRKQLPPLVGDLFQGATGRERCRFEGQQHVNGVSLSPDGKTVISGCEDGTARILEVATGREVCSLGGQGKGVQAVAFSPDGQRVLAGTEAGAVYLWRIRGKREEGCLRGHEGAVYSVAFSRDGRRALSGGADQTMRFRNLGTGKELDGFGGLKAPVTSVTFSPDGKYALCADWAGTVRRWKLPD